MTSAAVVERVLPLHAPTAPLVEIVIPVYNEAHVLEQSVTTLHAYLTDHFPFPWRITIADNASTDGTWAVAQRLCARTSHVWAVHLDEKGRGRALRAVWSHSDAAIVAYMDVDLSTDLDALLPLIAPLVSGHSDVAVGSRLAPGSRVVRGPKREVISRAYNMILRTVLRARFRDAQCGFKAARADAARALLPAVEDDGWFFDTELLVAAQRSGMRIHEVPVDWVDDPDSRVDVLHTAVEDLKGVWRVARHRTGRTADPAELPADMGRQLGRFAAIGVACTVAYIVGFLALRDPLGPWAANAVALTTTMLFNTWANRRFTFRRRGPDHLARHYLEAGVVYVGALVLSTGALSLVRSLRPDAGAAADTLALLSAGILTTLLRFVLMRAWVFHPRRT